jgi:choline dehydrogenase-like flavoprotein
VLGVSQFLRPFPAHRGHFSALKSPQVLELSGIGRSDVLEKISTQLKVELPGVGENFQEHLLFFVTYETKSSDTYETLDKLRDPKYVAEHMRLQYVWPRILHTIF